MRLLVKQLPYIALLIVSILYFAALNGYLSLYGDNANFILLSKGMLKEGRYCLPTRPNPPPHIQFPFVLPIMLMPIVAIFGYNFFLMKLLITFSAIGSVWLIYYLFRPIVGKWTAVLLMFLAGFSPYIGEFSHKVMSEFPFILFMLGGLIFLRRYQQENDWRTKNGLLAGVLITIAYFTRSIGLFVMVGAVAYLFLESISKSRWRLNFKKAVLIGLLFIVPCITWELRNLHLTGGNKPAYVRQFFMKDPYTPDLGTVDIKDLWERVHQNYDYYVKSFAKVVFNYRYKKFLGSWFLQDLIFYVILGGLVYCLIRRRTAVEYVALAYMLIIYTWPWKGTRFIVPIIPFAIYYFITGVRCILSLIDRIQPESIRMFFLLPLFLLGSYPLTTHLLGKANLSIKYWLLLFSISVLVPLGLRMWKQIEPVKSTSFVLAITLILAVLVWHVRVDIIREHREPYYYKINSYWGEYVDMAKWIKKNTPSDSIIMCRKPSLMYLWTERYVCIYPFTTDQARVLKTIAGQQVDYIAVDSFRWTNTTPKYLKPVIKENSNQFETVRQIGKSKIYKVKKF